MKPSLFALAPLSALVAIACAPQDNTIETVFDPCAPLVIDADGLSEPQRQSVFDGIAMWNQTASAALEVKDGDVDGRPQIPVRYEKAAAAFHGFYNDVEGVVYVNKEIDSAHARAVTVAHELGHAFGLVHIDIAHDSSVMNDGNLKTEPNRFDVDSLAALWGTCSPLAP